MNHANAHEFAHLADRFSPCETVINTKTKKILSNDLIERCFEKNIPIGKINTVEKVMQSKISKEMILEETINNQKTQRIKTVAFELTN